MDNVKGNLNSSIETLWNTLEEQELNNVTALRNVRAIFDGFRAGSDRETALYITGTTVSETQTVSYPKVNLHRTLVNLLVSRVIKDPLATKIINSGDTPEGEANNKKIQHLQNSIWNLNMGDDVKLNLVENALVDGYSAFFFEHRVSMLRVNSRKVVEFKIKNIDRMNLKFFYNSKEKLYIHRELLDKELIKIIHEQSKDTKTSKMELKDYLNSREPEMDTYDSIYCYTKYLQNQIDGSYTYSTFLSSTEMSNGMNNSSENRSAMDILIDSGTCVCLPFSVYAPIQDKFKGVGTSIIYRNAPHIKNINKIYSAVEHTNEVLGKVFVGMTKGSKDALKAIRDATPNSADSVVAYETHPDAKISIQQPSIANPTTLSFFQTIKELMYETNGVSKEAVQGVKPKGLRTGAAIREATNLEQSTYLSIINKYKSCYVAFNNNMLRLIDELMEAKHEKLKGVMIKVFADNETHKAISWSAFDYSKNLYAMMIEPISKIAETPEGRLEFIIELAKVANISSSQLVKLLNTPDLRALQEEIISTNMAVDAYVDMYVNNEVSEPSIGIGAKEQYDLAKIKYNKLLSENINGGNKEVTAKLKRLTEFLKITKELAQQEQLEALQLQQGSLAQTPQ